jgi:hypothetical protein
VQAIAATQEGAVAITGSFEGSLGAQSSPTDAPDAFIALRSRTGPWWRSLGIRGRASGQALTISSAGDVVAGVSARGRWAQAGLAGQPASLLVRLSRADGAVKELARFESPSYCLIHSLAAHGDNIVIGGSFASQLRVGDRTLFADGFADAFLAVVANDGELRWIRRIGGSGADSITAVATRGPMIVAAGYFSGNLAVDGNTATSADGSQDGFTAAFSDEGKNQWILATGSNGYDAVYDIDASGDSVIAVGVVGRDARIGDHASAAERDSQGLIMSLGSDGSLLWSTLVAASEEATATNVVVESGRITASMSFTGTAKIGETVLESERRATALVELRTTGAAIGARILGTNVDVTDLAATGGGIAVGGTYRGSLELFPDKPSRPIASGFAAELRR